MSHTVVIIQQVILPPPDAQTAAADGDAMSAEIRYEPSDNASPAQIGNQVERIVKRLTKLADE